MSWERGWTPTDEEGSGVLPLRKICETYVHSEWFPGQNNLQNYTQLWTWLCAILVWPITWLHCEVDELYTVGIYSYYSVVDSKNNGRLNMWTTTSRCDIVWKHCCHFNQWLQKNFKSRVLTWSHWAKFYMSQGGFGALTPAPLHWIVSIPPTQ